MAKGGRKITDLTGQKFGGLTVIERAHDYVSPKGQHSPQWLCKCDCGNNAVVRYTSLKNGTKSCGCVRKNRKRSEHAGIYHSDKTGKWTVAIHIGTFDTLEEATEARNKAKNLMFGE